MCSVVDFKHLRDHTMFVAEVFQRVGTPGIVGTPLLWKTSIYHYSVISVVFDSTNNVAHLVARQFNSYGLAYKGNS